MKEPLYKYKNHNYDRLFYSQKGIVISYDAKKMPSLNIDIPKSRCKGQGKSSRSVSHNIDKVVHESAQNE